MAQWLSIRLPRSLPPMRPGFNSRIRCHMWVEFAAGSRPCSESYSPGTPVFLPPQKPTFPNSNSTWKQWRKSHPVDSTEISLLLLLLVSTITVFAGVNFLFVHQPGASHAPGASVTQVNHSVQILSTFLRIRADSSMQIF